MNATNDTISVLLEFTLHSTAYARCPSASIETLDGSVQGTSTALHLLPLVSCYRKKRGAFLFRIFHIHRVNSSFIKLKEL